MFCLFGGDKGFGCRSFRPLFAGLSGVSFKPRSKSSVAFCVHVNGRRGRAVNGTLFAKSFCPAGRVALCTGVAQKLHGDVNALGRNVIDDIDRALIPHVPLLGQLGTQEVETAVGHRRLPINEQDVGDRGEDSDMVLLSGFVTDVAHDTRNERRSCLTKTVEVIQAYVVPSFVNGGGFLMLDRKFTSKIPLDF